MNLELNLAPARHRLEIYRCLPFGNVGRNFFGIIMHHSSKCPAGMCTRMRLDQETVITGIDVTEHGSEIVLNNELNTGDLTNGQLKSVELLIKELPCSR